MSFLSPNLAGAQHATGGPPHFWEPWMMVHRVRSVWVFYICSESTRGWHELLNVLMSVFQRQDIL